MLVGRHDQCAGAPMGNGRGGKGRRGEQTTFAVGAITTGERGLPVLQPSALAMNVDRVRRLSGLFRKWSAGEGVIAWVDGVVSVR